MSNWNAVFLKTGLSIYQTKTTTMRSCMCKARRSHTVCCEDIILDIVLSIPVVFINIIVNPRNHFHLPCIILFSRTFQKCNDN